MSTLQQSTVRIADLEAELRRLGESLALLPFAEVASRWPLRIFWLTFQAMGPDLAASQAPPARHLSLVRNGGLT